MFSKLNNHSTLYLISSLAIGGISSYFAYKYFNNQTENPSNLSQEQIDLTLKILRDLRTQLFSLYPTILNLHNSLFNRALIQTQQYYAQCEAILKEGGVQAEQLKQQFQLAGQEFVIGQSVDKQLIRQQIKKALKPEVINIVESKQNMVVKKFKCSVEELKEMISQCNDRRVLAIQNEIFESIEKSLEGKEIPIKLHQNDWKLLTKEKCLEVTKKILLNAGLKLRNMFEEIRQDPNINFNEISLADNQVITKIADLKLVDEKLNIIIAEGLGKLQEEDYAFALAKACQKYKKEDDVFSGKIDLLDKIHENIMDICMSLDREIISEQCILDLYAGNLDIDAIIQQQKANKEKEYQDLQEQEQLQNNNNNNQENILNQTD